VRTDVYTKLMLTIIACCLVWLCLTGAFPITALEAQTPSAPDRVLLAGWVDSNGYVRTFPPVGSNINPLPVAVVQQR